MDYAAYIIECARSFAIDARIIGRVKKSVTPKLVISAEGKSLEYVD
jgi:hypothetical protein